MSASGPSGPQVLHLLELWLLIDVRISFPAQYLENSPNLDMH